MIIKVNKEIGLTIKFTEEDARELMIMAFNSRSVIPARAGFKQKLISLLTKEGVNT